MTTPRMPGSFSDDIESGSDVDQISCHHKSEEQPVEPRRPNNRSISAAKGPQRRIAGQAWRRSPEIRAPKSKAKHQKYIPLSSTTAPVVHSGIDAIEQTFSKRNTQKATPLVMDHDEINQNETLPNVEDQNRYQCSHDLIHQQSERSQPTVMERDSRAYTDRHGGPSFFGKLKKKIIPGDPQEEINRLQIEHSKEIRDLKDDLEFCEEVIALSNIKLEETSRELHELRQQHKLLITSHAEVRKKIGQVELELSSLQVKDYEFNRKGAMLLDTSAQSGIEEIFIDQISTWTRMYFRGLPVEVVCVTLQKPENYNSLCDSLSEVGILSSNWEEVLRRVGVPTFFQIFITDTLIKWIFAEPFKDCGDFNKKDSFDDFYRVLGSVDIVSANKWRADTVKLMEGLGHAAAKSTLNYEDWGNKARTSWINMVHEKMISGLLPFLQSNPRLDGMLVLEGVNKLHDIIQKFDHLCHEWHRRPLHIVPLRGCNLQAQCPDLKWRPEKHKSCYMAYKNDAAETDGKSYDIGAVVTPGLSSLAMKKDCLILPSSGIERISHYLNQKRTIPGL